LGDGWMVGCIWCIVGGMVGWMVHGVSLVVWLGGWCMVLLCDGVRDSVLDSVLDGVLDGLIMTYPKCWGVTSLHII